MFPMCLLAWQLGRLHSSRLIFKFIYQCENKDVSHRLVAMQAREHFRELKIHYGDGFAIEEALSHPCRWIWDQIGGLAGGLAG